MKLTAHGTTHTGQVRPINEDAFLSAPSEGVFAVADGLGGLPDGSQASHIIVARIEEYLKARNQAGCPELAEFIETMNKDLTNEGQEKHPFIGWGSTLTLCAISENILRIIHAGDSVVYRVRNRYMSKLTLDHTMEHQYIRRHGEASRSLMPMEYEHTLTRCMGQSLDLKLDQKYLKVKPEDILLLCTDGISKYVDEEDIRQALVYESSPKKAAELLIKLANKLGGPDNATAVVVHIEE